MKLSFYKQFFFVSECGVRGVILTAETVHPNAMKIENENKACLNSVSKK